ncbi:hypothetical protein [Zhihengliuella flava]|uniref:Uncharacterized protein n=1 Tax=Zhihengliuella flava TaxID=1285193 RepID=A0A931D599_9MICC|nr:hypothetical protein [Zhihengliuella flava]MBG6084689.1 hypothetical protein [Zhihengliuella flava]
MSQPIDVGAVLGGRYKVTGSVLTSDEGDLVLAGMDQVLNRTVSILVATAENSAQLTSSAREIARGERASNVQVLDLGTSGDSTYLITNTAAPVDLLDLLVQSEGPYVEPFYTDTLGSEIFGESRSKEPQRYEDDDEYYAELEEHEHRNPLAGRFNSLRSRFSRGGAAGAGAAAAHHAEGDSEATGQQPVADSPHTEENDAVSPTPTAAAPQAPRPEAQAPAPRVEDYDAPEDAPQARHGRSAAGAGAAGAAAGAAAASAAGAGGAASSGAGDSRPPSTFPAAARDYQDEEAATATSAFAYEDADEEEGGNKFTRLIVGAVLGIVLIVAVVFAFNMLGSVGGDDAPQAGGDSTTSAEESASSSASSEGSAAPSESSDQLPAPAVAGIQRIVPGNQELNADTDNTLGDAVDGNEATIYATYSYAQPAFGGFASNMILAVELEEASQINQIELTGLNGSGGSYEVAIGDSNDFGSAQVVTQGSFTGPTVSVPVTEESKTSGTHVFVNVTELPRLANPYNDSRPYGLQIAEIKVS